ncbi:MAG: ribose 5-phosphate isomerase B [Desulfitobacteriaceae bacterium]|nr:ribose 5-phosphate isomerase B [Desulfitobacteriaceae bacterium]MDD4345306.1 ribose 5-phosphate isomerase B [Desulfitobacteriaceae bacterium]MDD4400489.1 ribose 5-phosphate isomerase B [Desulfitobacteriaceae bacterium]
MKVALGSDHGGFQLKNEVDKYLRSKGIEVLDCGTNSTDSVDYPLFGYTVGQALLSGRVDFGIVICGTGQGIAMTANKLPGIRAAVCTETYSARMSREHNNANILALGGRITGVGVALDIVDVFLNTDFAGGRHSKRLELMVAVERGEKI